MRNTAFGLIASGVFLLAVATSPSMQWWKKARSYTENRIVGDCGAVALALVCQADNTPRSLGEIRQRAHCASQGTDLFSLKEAAESLGYTCVGTHLGFESLRENVHKPHHFAILHIVPNHFIAVLGATDGGHLRTAGLGQSSSDSDEAELREMGWDGVALLLHASPRETLLEMEPGLIDLGRIPVSCVKDFSATIRNRNTQKVEIAEIKSNCGCANLQIERSSLEGGANARLTGHFRASSQPGTVRKRITFTIAHPRRQVFEVELVAQVVRTLPVTPDSLILRPNFVTGEQGVGEAVVRNEWNDSIRLMVPASQGSLSLELHFPGFSYIGTFENSGKRDS